MELSDLPVEEGVRQRGVQVTRMETFVDAAFAFAVTLLVVSFDAMPTSFVELYDALRKLPAFLAGFAILAVFWRAHDRFSRRYGLEDGVVLFLSLSLVAVTLFYVYPLRMVMSSGMAFFTGGWAAAQIEVRSFHEFRMLFVIYGLGFAALALVIAALNWHVLRKAAQLQLNPVERLVTQAETASHIALAACAGLSIAVALWMPDTGDWRQGMPGFVYALLAIVSPWLGAHYGRRQRALAQAMGGG